MIYAYLLIFKGELLMKRCPNCNAEVPDDAKFCTHCGAKLAAVPAAAKSEPVAAQNNQPQQPFQRKANSQDFQNSLNSYWKWLVGSWKKPFENQITNKYFGLITLLLEVLLFTLGVGHLAQKGAAVASNAANNINDIKSLFSGSSSSTVSSSYTIGFGFYISIILIIFLAAVAMVGVSFLILHAVGGNQSQESFLNYLNRLAHYSNSILILDIAFCLILFLASVGSTSVLLSLLILSLISIIWTITLTLGVTTFKNSGQFDRIYGAIISAAICSIIEIVALSLIASKLGDTVSSFFQSLF